MSSENKDNSLLEMIKLGLILVCYAVASCTVLAIVNNLTSPKIIQNQLVKANLAMKAVFAEADEFEKKDDFSRSEDKTITVSDFYLAKKDGSVVGGVVQVSGPTYEKGKIIISLDTNGVVKGMQFLELSDSPGFGLKANDSTYIMKNGKTFYGQFAGKDANNGFVANENYDAISGATITSVAVGKLLNEGTKTLLMYFKEHDYE
ncbi:MAG: FMN-binding protein [Treponema sp.]|nr:FMN-binding protein [Treponema sp.]